MSDPATRAAEAEVDLRKALSLIRALAETASAYGEVEQAWALAVASRHPPRYYAAVERATHGFARGAPVRVADLVESICREALA